MVAPKGTQTDLIQAIEHTRAQGMSVIQLLGQDDLTIASICNAPVGECCRSMDCRTDLITSSGKLKPEVLRI